ncbi:MAG: isoprenoid biosynthesis glyoxalase ElbB [Bacteroidota bacterium]
MKCFALILSGCGVYDGAEIHESVLTLLALENNHCQYEIFAPNIPQHHVKNHLTGDEMPESRNVLVESARIARGKIKSLDQLVPVKFDGLIFPGGFGVAKNLCTYAFNEVHCKVNPEVEQTIQQFHKAGKPIGGLCIAPVMIAKVLGGIEVTIGNDAKTASHIRDMGAKHTSAQHGVAVVDKKNKIVTAACYMLDATLPQIYSDADALLKAMLDIC